MDKTIPFNFSVEFNDEVKPLTPTLSLARCRIFYKGLNRNGSYITDDFAEKLIQTLPYTPIKGIYDGEVADYGTHRYDSPRGQIYGVVPGVDRLNFAWEKHLDEDGVEREYATCNVILYTAIFDEAHKIPEKSQSMELFPPSVKGDWQKDFTTSQEVFVFEDGCFLGLQVLGDAVEPCFEGAAFYALEELKNQFNLILDEIKTFEQNIDKESEEVMPFKYSIPEDKLDMFSKLWETLNTNFTEEKGFLIDYDICSINEDNAVIFDLNNQSFNTISWEVAEDGTYSYSELNPIEYVEMTDDLKAVKEANDGTFENLNEKFSNMTSKISEYETTISTFNTEKENYEAQLAEKDTQLSEKEAAFSALETEVNDLRAFKEGIEQANKEAIVNKYEKKLPEDQIASFKENLSNYDAVELEKELALAFVNANQSLFDNQPKEDEGLEYKFQDSGLAAILSKYENNLNKSE